MGIPNIVTLIYIPNRKVRPTSADLQFTPESETASIPFTFIWESLPWGPQRRLDVEESRREIIIAQRYDRVYLCGKQKKGTSRERGGD